MPLKTYNWNRKLLNYLWIMVGISFLVPIINYPFTSLTFLEFIVHRLAIPVVFQLIIMCSLEYVRHYKNKYLDYYMIVGSLTMVLTMILAHAPIAYVMLSLFILPMFISVFSIEPKKIMFAFLLTLASFFHLNYLHSAFSMDVVETITFLFILCSAAFLSLELTRRFRHLNEERLHAVSNEKELLFKTIQMEKMSKLDLPTNLYNHKTFHEYLERLWEQYQNNPFELHMALLDLDNFKAVNDIFGHAAGDIVIRETANIIQINIDDNDFASRYGGEEFAILFIDKNAMDCVAILEIIRKQLSCHSFDILASGRVTVSIGLASAKSFDSKEAFFKGADMFLYQAKKTGKNQVVSSIKNGQ